MKVMHPKMLVRIRVGKKRSSLNLSLALSLQDLTSDSPYCLIMMVFFFLKNSVLVLDPLIVTCLMLFFILITCLLDIALILLGEILSWSLMGVVGLK